MEFMGCGHIFCRECVAAFFEVTIKDGNVHGLICPEKGCKSEALQSQVCQSQFFLLSYFNNFFC